MKQQKRVTQMDNIYYRNAISLVFSEVIFNILPLGVLAGLLLYQGKFLTLFSSSEWSMVSAILFGQTITKLVSSIISKRLNVHAPRVIAFITAILAFGVIPSIITFLFIYNSTSVGTGLILVQVFLFFSSLVAFVIIGGAGEWMANKVSKQ